MRHFTFPTQDASIYQYKPSQNTGLDEVLEVGKSYPNTGSVRSLVQFDIEQFSASLASGEYPPDTSFDLVLYPAEAKKMKRNQVIYITAISQSWVEGEGYFFQDVYQRDLGVNWNVRETGSNWTIPGGDVVGEVVSSSISTTQLETYFSKDITTIVSAWVSGTIPNNGLLIQFATSDEQDSNNRGNIKFFSGNTHTVYRPMIVAKWNDQSYVTSSARFPSKNLLVSMYNVQPIYSIGEVPRIDLAVREQYPLKTFDTRFTAWVGNRYLPSSSYFKIIDEQNGMDVIPFDEYSKISCDESGSYFKFKVDNMYPYRYYRIILKVEHEGVVNIFDNDLIFTVR